MKVDEFINKLQNTLNKLINENYLSIKSNELLNELLETLKIMENCTSCKDEKIDGNNFDKGLVELEKAQQGKKDEHVIKKLNDELNRKILCESCEGKKIEKLTDKCKNEEMARLIYDNSYIRWIPFNEFRNIEYLAKGGFGEVHKATWINGYYNKYEGR